MRVFVNIFHLKNIALEVEPNDTIDSLKQKIIDEEDIGISADQQRLFFCFNELNDDNTLADYNINDDSTLRLVLRLKAYSFYFIKFIK